MCELHQRWPQLHFRDFYLAALVGATQQGWLQ
jgi:hypothetical protein